LSGKLEAIEPQKCTKIGDGSLKTPEKRVVDWILGS
jgi:hypothetical protein